MTQKTADLAREIVDAALNRHASNIVLLDVQEVCSFTDYFVLCNGESERQLRAISEEIDEVLSAKGITMKRHQGNPNSGWLIIDAGDIVIHIFSPEKREYYKLEDVWHKGNTVVKIL